MLDNVTLTLLTLILFLLYIDIKIKKREATVAILEKSVAKNVTQQQSLAKKTPNEKISEIQKETEPMLLAVSETIGGTKEEIEEPREKETISILFGKEEGENEDQDQESPVDDDNQHLIERINEISNRILQILEEFEKRGYEITDENLPEDLKKLKEEYQKLKEEEDELFRRLIG